MRLYNFFKETIKFALINVASHDTSSSVLLAYIMQAKSFIDVILEEPLSLLVEEPCWLKEFMDSLEVLLSDSTIYNNTKHLRFLLALKKNTLILVEEVLIYHQVFQEYEDRVKAYLKWRQIGPIKIKLTLIWIIMRRKLKIWGKNCRLLKARFVRVARGRSPSLNQPKPLSLSWRRLLLKRMTRTSNVKMPTKWKWKPTAIGPIFIHLLKCLNYELVI